MDQPSTCTVNAKESSDTKSAYARRQALVKASQEVPFATNLHLDFLTCPRYYKSAFFNIFPYLICYPASFLDGYRLDVT